MKYDYGVLIFSVRLESWAGRVAATLPYSKSTVDRYLVEAEREGYIKRDQKGIWLLDKNLFIIDEKSVYELTREFYPEILTDEDRREHTVHN